MPKLKSSTRELIGQVRTNFEGSRNSSAIGPILMERVIEAMHKKHRKRILKPLLSANNMPDTKCIVSSLLSCLLVFCNLSVAALAEPNLPSAPVAHVPMGGGSRAPQTSLNLNLASTSPIYSTAGSASPSAPTQTGTVPIRVGNEIVTVQPGSHLLTPAENLAAFQVRSTGQQSLILGALGNAIGGSFTIGQRLSQYVNNLEIPQGVTAKLNSSILNLSGNVINSGVIFVAPSNSAQAAISATNILNNQGALISSGYSAFGMPTSSPVNLILKASDSIVNHGAISSTGYLSLIAGKSIVNDLPGGTAATQARIEAVSNVNLTSGAGIIRNGGLIASGLGNVNLYAPIGHDLAINNTNGRLEALKGAVNVGSGQCGLIANSNIFGGDILANQINFNAGSGNVIANVNSISGLVNASGAAAHVTVNDGTLQMGNINLSGDPTFYNSNGSININGDIAVGEALTIAASGNITATANGAFKLSAPSSDINLIAGATFTSANGATSTDVGPGSGTPANSITISTATQSATGGNIDFSNNGVASISSAATVAGAAGGNVRIVAFPSSTGAAGQVLLTPTSSIYSSGNGIGANGNVTVIAGARAASAATGTGGTAIMTAAVLDPTTSGTPTTTGNAITLGSIVANGGTSSVGGAVTISNMTPAFTNGTTSMTFNSTGNIASGNDFSSIPTNFGSGNIALNGDISAKTVTVNGGTSGDISLAGVVSGSTSVKMTANGTGNIVQTTSVPSINSPVVTVTSTQGNVGSSMATPLIIKNGAAGAITLANSSPSTGNMFVQSTSSGLLTLNYINVAGTAYINNNGGNVATGSTAAGILQSSICQGGTINLSTVSSNGLNNGNITIQSPVLAKSAVNLSAGGSGNIAIPTGYSGDFILSPSVSLSSVSGNIGSAVQPIYMANFYSGSPASPLTLSTNITGAGNTGSAYIEYDGANNSLILNSSSVGGTLQVTTMANMYGPTSNYGITVAAPVKAGNVVLNTISGNRNNNGQIVLASTLTGTSSVNLTTGGTGSIIQTTPGASILSPNVLLAARNGGNIGQYNVQGVQFSNLPGNFNAVNLTANASGSVFLVGTGNVNLAGASSSGSSSGFSLLAAGGNLNIGAGATVQAANGIIALSAGSALTQSVAGATTLLSQNVQLYGGSTVGSALAPIGVGYVSDPLSIVSIQANGNNAVYVSSLAAASVSGASFGLFNASAGGNLTLSNLNNQPTSVFLQTRNNGNININGNVWTAPSGSITLNANGIGTITEGNGAGLMTGTLRMTSGTGNIGSVTSPILVYGGALIANTLGSVYVNYSNPTFATIGNGFASGSSSAGGTFQVMVSGTNSAALNITSPITAPTVALTNYGAGSINLAALVTGTTSATLTALAAGNITQSVSSATISSPSITLTSNGGNIGTSTQNPIVIQNGNFGAVNLRNASAGTANMYVKDISTGNLNLNYISASGTAYINADGGNVLSGTTAAGINIAGPVMAGNIVLSTSSANGFNNGNITISSVLVGANSVNLAAGGSGNVAIQPGYSGIFILSRAVSLSSVSGNIGLVSQPVTVGNNQGAPLTLAVSITGAQNTGNAYVENDISPLVLNASSVGGTLQVRNQAGLFGGITNYGMTVAGPVSANNVVLGTVSGSQNNNGPIVLASTVSGRTSVSITAGGTGSITQSVSGPTVLSPTIALNAGAGGNIGDYNLQSIQIANVAGNGNPINLTANAAGNVFLVSSNAVNLVGPSSSNGSSGFNLLSAGGNLNLAQGTTVSAPNGTLSLSAGYSYSITQSLPGTTLLSPSVQLYAGSSIGSVATPITISNPAGVLSLSANASNAVFVNSLGSAIVTGASNGMFQATAGGNLTVPTSIGNQPTSVLLQTSNNGNIVINGNIWTTASGAITLNANGTGTISEGNGAGLMTGTLTMTSGTGNIGSAATPILVYGGALVANTIGSVYVNYSNPTFASVGTGSTAGSSSAGGVFQVGLSGTNAADLNVVSPITAQTVTLTNNGAGNINLAALVTGTVSATIATRGAGNISQSISTATVNSPTITLASAGGNVGSSISNPLVIQNGAVGSVSLSNTFGIANMYIQNVSAGNLNLGYISAAGTAYINNSGNAYGTGTIIAGSISANTINLSTVSANGLNNGNIVITGVLNAKSAVILAAGGAGNVYIPNGYSGDFILSPSVALSSVRGNIGSATQPIYLANFYSGSPASPLTLSANITGDYNQGNAYIEYDGANSSLILNASSVGGTLQVTTQANMFGPTSNYGITVAAPVSASNVILNTISGNHNNNGSITLASTVTGTNSVTLTTGGTGSITQSVSGATIASPSIVLNATNGGNIGNYNVQGVQFTNLVGNTNPVNLTANATGDVFLVGNNGVNMVGTSSSNGTNGFSLLAAGGNLNINYAATVSAPNGKISLSTGSVGSIMQSVAGINTLFSPSVELNAGMSIGTMGSPIGVSNGTNQISLLASADNAVYVTTAGSALLSGASNGMFQVTSGGNLTVANFNNQPSSVLLQTSNNGNIAINGNIWTTATGTIVLNANGAGSISSGNGAGMLTRTLTMTSGSGNIGSSSSPILLYGGVVVANTLGNVYVNFLNPNFAAVGTSSPSATSSAGGVFQASVSGTNGASLYIMSPITAPSVTLTNNGTGDINLSALVTGTTAIKASTNGIGSINQTIGTATLNSPMITLTAAGGNVGYSMSNPLLIQNGTSGSVTLSNASPGTANMYVQNVNAGNLFLNYINVNGTAYLSNNGGNAGAAAGITVTGSVRASTVNLSTLSASGLNNGNITLASVVLASNATVLQAGGYGNVATAPGYSGDFLLSPTVAVSSVRGNIGSAAQPLSIANYYSGSPPSPLVLSANITGAGNTGSAYINYDGGNNTLILNGALVGGTLQVTTQANVYGPASNYGITVAAPVRANNVVLNTISGGLNNNGSISLLSTVTGTTSVTLTAGGSGNITQATSTPSIISPNVSLTSILGNIGASSSSLMTASTGTIKINSTINPLGTVNLQNTGYAVTLNAPRSGGDMNILSTGSLYVLGAATTQNGSINLTVGSGILQVGNGSQPTSLLATNGSISLRNLDTNLATSSAIAINAATLKGSSTTPGVGQVSIFFGAAPTVANPITSKPYVIILQSGGAHVFAGVNGFTAIAPTSLLNAEGRDIVISTANRPASAIRISGASITADPPSQTPAAINLDRLNVTNGLMSTKAAASANASTINQPFVPTMTSTTAASSLTSNVNAGPIALPETSYAVINATQSARAAIWTSADSFPASTGVADLSDSTTGTQTKVVIYSGNRFKTLEQEAQKPATHIAPVSFAASAQRVSNSMTTYGIDGTFEQAKDLTSVNLRKGSILFAPDSDMEVRTQFGQVNIARGAVVLIVATSNVVSVYDLHDNHRNQVSISAGNCRMSLAPGHHISIATATNHNFENVNHLGMIGHRNLRTSTLTSGLVQFDSEFSLMSALNGLNALSALQHSKNAREHAIVEEVLKNAAIIQTVKAGNGTYQRIVREAVAQN